MSNRTCFQQYYCLTSIFKTQNESHPEDSKVKMKHIISFPGEKGLDFSPHLCILNNSIQPWRNVKSLRFSSDFLNFSSSSFNITPIILLRQVLILTKLCIPGFSNENCMGVENQDKPNCIWLRFPWQITFLLLNKLESINFCSP